MVKILTTQTPCVTKIKGKHSMNKIILSACITLAFSSVAFADVDIPCVKKDETVRCPVEILNEGSNVLVTKMVTSGEERHIDGKNKDKFSLEFQAVSGDRFNLLVVDDQTKNKGCDFTFTVTEKNGNYYGNYYGMKPVGHPKACVIGGDDALIASVNAEG